MSELAGFPIDVEYCPHPAGPPTCCCRMPLPGLGVLLITATGSTPRDASTSAAALRILASRESSDSRIAATILTSKERSPA